MRVALMQPYLFPYIGYFQLISAVDLFIVYDDVQYIKNGWINRNRVLTEGEVSYLTLPVKKDSSKKYINQREFVDTIEHIKKDILANLEAEYVDAPYYKEVILLVERCFSYKEQNVARFVEFSIREVCKYMGISTEIAVSSDIQKTEGLRAQNRVIDIVKAVGGTMYINAAGGTELYDKQAFQENGLELFFIKTKPIKYLQFGEEYIPHLSIIDMLMFNSKEKIQEFTCLYELE